MTRDQQETEAYLAKIRKTIAESNRLVEQAELRIQETDRLLASQGLTREQVANYKFTPQQRAAVNRVLVENGYAPFEDEEEESLSAADAPFRDPDAPLRPPPGDEVEERQKKFGMMMKPFMI